LASSLYIQENEVQDIKYKRENTKIEMMHGDYVLIFCLSYKNTKLFILLQLNFNIYIYYYKSN